MRKTVVYFGSREIYRDIQTAARSMLAHNTGVEIVTITQDPEPFPELGARNIMWREPGELFNSLNTCTKWGVFGVIRAALTKLLPEHDVVLSVDADTITTGDVGTLFDLDMSGKFWAAVRETALSEASGRPYYNAGVCLLNLKRIRAYGKDVDMIRALNSRPYRYVSQDALNEHLNTAALELPSKYNACRFTAQTDAPVILHFADCTDWRARPEVEAFAL